MDFENHSYMSEFPTEIILHIFNFLKLKYLAKCRRVCKRWNDIINHMCRDDSMWKKYCALEFPDIYLEAKEKSIDCRTWLDLYRVLAQWGRINEASEHFDEFCHSSYVAHEIIDIFLLNHGVLGIHRRTSVLYYDISTLLESPRPAFHRNAFRYFENEEVAASLTAQLHLSVYRVKKNALPQESHLELIHIFDSIKNFYYCNKNVFFITSDNQIFSYDVKKRLEDTKAYNWLQDISIISMSWHNELLYILTIDRTVSAYKNDRFEPQLKLDDVPNIMDLLWKYKFMKEMDWRIYLIWMSQLGRFVTEGPLQFLYTVQVYGDLFLVGCQCGILRLYYKPYINGELDLYNSTPVKHYNFSQRSDIPVLAMHPILKMEVVEVNGGHLVIVAMSKKIIMIRFMHDENMCKALLPYTKRPSLEFFMNRDHDR